VKNSSYRSPIYSRIFQLNQCIQQIYELLHKDNSCSAFDLVRLIELNLMYFLAHFHDLLMILTVGAMT